jgi:hypothetical protein
MRSKMMERLSSVREGAAGERRDPRPLRIKPPLLIGLPTQLLFIGLTW